MKSRIDHRRCKQAGQETNEQFRHPSRRLQLWRCTASNSRNGEGSRPHRSTFLRCGGDENWIKFCWLCHDYCRVIVDQDFEFGPVVVIKLWTSLRCSLEKASATPARLCEGEVFLEGGVIHMPGVFSHLMQISK